MLPNIHNIRSNIFTGCNVMYPNPTRIIPNAVHPYMNIANTGMRE